MIHPDKPRALAVETKYRRAGELHRAGKSYQDIATEMGISLSYAYNLVRAEGNGSPQRRSDISTRRLSAEIAKLEARLDALHHLSDTSQRLEEAQWKRKSERPKRIAAMVEEGKSYADIARSLGVGYSRTVQLVHGLGLRCRRKPRWDRGARREAYIVRQDAAHEIVGLLTKGLSLREIGEKMGKSHEWVRQAIRPLGVSARSLRRTQKEARLEIQQQRQAQIDQGLRARPCPLCDKPCDVARNARLPFCETCRKVFAAERRGLYQVFSPHNHAILAAWMRGETKPGICCLCGHATRKGLTGEISFHATCGAKKAIAVRIHTAQSVIRRHPQFDWRKIIVM